MWDDPNNIIPANAMLLSEAFEQAFDAMWPDAAKLRAEIGRIFEGDRPEHQEIWFNWDKARSEVLKEFRRGLASDALRVYRRNPITGEEERFLPREWDELPYMLDIVDEFPPRFVFRADFEPWLNHICPPSGPVAKNRPGRPPNPDYDRKDLEQFIYEKMKEKGGDFSDDLLGWQSQADLHKLICDYYQRLNRKIPATSTLYVLVKPILARWREEHSSSGN